MLCIFVPACNVLHTMRVIQKKTMKTCCLSILIAAGLLFTGCAKNSVATGCDMLQVYANNAKKVTIDTGAWGTVSSMEGNCMPMVPPASGACSTCPVQRTVKIYEYTLYSQAVRADSSNIFFESFSTDLIAQADADKDGFFQVSIPPGRYTIAVVENGKLYVSGSDGVGGLAPFLVQDSATNVNVMMTYKAVF